jgi:hypothetical protein
MVDAPAEPWLSSPRLVGFIRKEASMRFQNVASFVGIDRGGREHMLVIQQEVINATDLTSGSDTIPGIRRIRTSDGRSVNKIGPGRYHIIGGIDPIEVASSDPIAP